MARGSFLLPTGNRKLQAAGYNPVGTARAFPTWVPIAPLRHPWGLHSHDSIGPVFTWPPRIPKNFPRKFNNPRGGGILAKPNFPLVKRPIPQAISSPLIREGRGPKGPEHTGDHLTQRWDPRASKPPRDWGHLLFPAPVPKSNWASLVAPQNARNATKQATAPAASTGERGKRQTDHRSPTFRIENPKAQSTGNTGRATRHTTSQATDLNGGTTGPQSPGKLLPGKQRERAAYEDPSKISRNPRGPIEPSSITPQEKTSPRPP